MADELKDEVSVMAGHVQHFFVDELRPWAEVLHGQSARLVLLFSSCFHVCTAAVVCTSARLPSDFKPTDSKWKPNDRLSSILWVHIDRTWLLLAHGHRHGQRSEVHRTQLPPLLK